MPNKRHIQSDKFYSLKSKKKELTSLNVVKIDSDGE